MILHRDHHLPETHIASRGLAIVADDECEVVPTVADQLLLFLAFYML